jgi:adenosine deaminase
MRICSARGLLAAARTLALPLVLGLAAAEPAPAQQGRTAPERAAARSADGPAASPEERTARYFDELRGDPLRTLMFLREMPKGADLHSHLSGAVYAETYIAWAAEDGLCVAVGTGGYVQPPCDAAAGRPPAAQALRDAALYDLIVDAQSMRNWHPSQRSGHAHMFGAFDKFRLVSHRTGEMLAEIVARAAAGRVAYLELMLTPEGPATAELGRSVGWSDDPAALRGRLLEAGLRDTLARVHRMLDAVEAKRRELLGCETAQPAPGCDVVVRFQYQALRARAPEQVFAYLLAGFELASTDPRVVGINFVQPEDHVVAMRDFSLHMSMIDGLRRFYPDVRLTLHAGELAAGLVPPEGLRFHIRESIERGHASRIGHGTAIAHEDDADGLLRQMAARGVLVEIALSSNDAILGVRGRDHPLRLYLAYGVPVALVTDDEGVLRTEMSMEYLRAADEHGLGYRELKAMARSSLEHAFVEGASLWSAAGTAVPVAACAGGLQSADCRQYIRAHTRARLQWELEQAFADFEQEYGERAWTAR